MARWETHRSDANADALYGFLRAHGASVDVIDRPLDALVGFQGVTAIVEVKTATGALRDSQKAFLANWRGLAAVLRSEADCLALLQLMRQHAGGGR